MSLHQRVLLFVLALCAGSSCTKSNANFCIVNEDCPETGYCDQATGVCGELTAECESCAGDAPICAVDATCQPCQSNGECAALGLNIPMCSEQGACVECLSQSDCEGELLCSSFGECVQCERNADCTAANMPTCGDDQTCRACTKDSDCDTGICDEDSGSCLPEAEIVYVDPQGSDEGSCGTLAAPCQSLAQAVVQAGGARNNIFLAAGVYVGTTTISKAVNVVSHGDAILQGDDALERVVQVGPAFVAVRIENIIIKASTSQGGLRCENVNSLDLSGVQVDNEGNTNTGIDLVSCPATIRKSLVEKAGYGLTTVSGGNLVLERSIIRNNVHGGVLITTNCSVLNNLVLNNGTVSPGSEEGGMAIYAGNLNCEIAFNTIAGNVNGSGEVTGEALICPNSTTIQPDVHHNIFASPGLNVTNSAGGCVLTNNLFSHDAEPGTGNIAGNPLFVNAPGGDYHLLPESPAINAGGNTAVLDIDFDGNLRPREGLFDMGAFEHQP